MLDQFWKWASAAKPLTEAEVATIIAAAGEHAQDKMRSLDLDAALIAGAWKHALRAYFYERFPQARKPSTVRARDPTTYVAVDRLTLGLRPFSFSPFLPSHFQVGPPPKKKKPRPGEKAKQ